jgi:hypothetical protein
VPDKATTYVGEHVALVRIYAQVTDLRAQCTPTQTTPYKIATLVLARSCLLSSRHMGARYVGLGYTGDVVFFEGA